MFIFAFSILAPERYVIRESTIRHYVGHKGRLLQCFFPVKIKATREMAFCTLSGFFHGCELFFTGSFSKTFTCSPKFSRVHFEIFSPVKANFHG